MLREIRNPNLYHGHHKNNFFEGWYFKLQDETGKAVLAVIPGIFKGDTVAASHSFIQILIGNEVTYHYLRFEPESFSSQKSKFKITVKDNTFSLDGIRLNIHEKDISIEGVLKFTSIIEWPDTLMNPGSMGFYNYFAFMECYSQVCALDGSITGSLCIQGKTISFDRGKVYIEKNWGRSFPKSWIWVQCNHFSKGDGALSCSIGHIPFLCTSFRGFLVGFNYRHQFISFTTINKSTIAIEKNGTDVTILLRRKEFELIISTKTNPFKFVTCFGPSGTEMIPLVDENLMGTVRVRLVDWKNHRVLFEDDGICTGIEYGGDGRILD